MTKNHFITLCVAEAMAHPMDWLSPLSLPSEDEAAASKLNLIIHTQIKIAEMAAAQLEEKNYFDLFK